MKQEKIPFQCANDFPQTKEKLPWGSLLESLILVDLGDDGHLLNGVFAMGFIVESAQGTVDEIHHGDAFVFALMVDGGCDFTQADQQFVLLGTLTLLGAGIKCRAGQKLLSVGNGIVFIIDSADVFDQSDFIILFIAKNIEHNTVGVFCLLICLAGIGQAVEGAVQMLF